MQQPVPDEIKRADVSLNGLDEVFKVDATVCDDFDQPDITLDKGYASLDAQIVEGLTIKEASSHYGLAVTTVRMKIKLGEIPATKVNGPKGPEWRVYPKGIPQRFDQPDISIESQNRQPDINVSSIHREPSDSVAEGFHMANINVASLIKANQELTAKLEGVVYRNGYLEAQLDAERNQIKLLTDQLHKPEQVKESGWWSIFCSWFKA